MSVSYIEPLQKPEVTYMRTRFEENGYPFDPWTFNMPLDDAEQMAANSNQAAFQGKKQKSPLPSKTMLIWNPSLDEFVIDLQKKCLIKELRLLFGKHENTQFKFKVSLYGVLDTSKIHTNKVLLPKRILLHQQIYEDDHWVQLVEFAHTPGPAFDPAEELEALNINQLNFMGRYLILQLQYIKCFKTYTEEDSTVPDITIIPEVYGREVESCPVIEEYENAFKSAEAEENKKSNLKSGHAMLVAKTELTKRELILYSNWVDVPPTWTEAKKEEAKSSTSGEVKEIGANLKKLQSELALLIQEHAAGQHDKKDQIQKLIKEINKEHKEIFISGTSNPSKEHSLQYLVSICLEYGKIVRMALKDKPIKTPLQFDIPLAQFAKTLFKIFVVNERGPQREELLKLLKEVIIPRLDDNEWIIFIFDSISEFLSTPCQYFSQRAVINALDYLSIPDGEILSFLVNKLQVPELKEAVKTLLPTKETPKVGPAEVSKFSLMSSVLLLALNSLKKINLPEGEDVHKGVVCNCCNNQRWISGVRFKCGHCPNFNICSNEKCIERHLQEFPDHVFIIIPLPLPYSPSPKDMMNIQVKPLLPSFTYVSSSNIHEGIDCDICGTKNFTGIRYLCGNCDDYNMCSSCFGKKSAHNPNHVFLRITKPLEVSQSGTPKPYIQLLDPLLYALPTGKQKEEQLLPLVSKRCYSLASPLIPIGNIMFERLDYDQNMILAYSICKWICTSNLFPHEQKIVLLKLSIELFVCLTKMVNVETLKSLLDDGNSFVQLVMHVLNINDSSITNYFSEIVESLKNPPGVKQLPQDQVQKMIPRNRVAYMEKQEISLQIKVLLCRHIQTMLKNLVEIAYSQSLIETSPLYSIYWSQQIWNEHLSYLLELFLGVAEKANIQKKDLKLNQKQEKQAAAAFPPLPLMRSISLMSEKDKVKRVEATLEESSTLSITIIKSLTNLLNPHNCRLKVAHHIANLWTLVLKALTMIPLKSVVETKIFDTLVHSFLQSPEEVQQTTYAEILKMTQKIVKEPAQIEETSRFLLNFLFATLDLAVGTANETLAYNVCSGWLDILISKETPKPENYAGEIFVKLDEEDSLLLLRKGVGLLCKHLSFGSIEGIALSQNTIVMRIEILCDVFRLIASAKNSKGQMAISELFINSKKYEKEMETTIPELITWLLLNEKSAAHNSFASEMLFKISSYIQEILEHLNESEVMIKLGLRTLIEFVSVFDKQIYQLSESGAISFSVSTKLNDRINKLLLRLIEAWVTSDNIAVSFALELKGFQFLLDRILTADTCSKRLTQIQEDKKTKSQAQPISRPKLSIESDIENAIWEALSSSNKDMAKEEEFSVNLSKKYEPNTYNLDDFGKNMLIENTSAGDVLTSYANTDWCTNKKGYRHKVFSKALTGDLKNEFVMNFKLKTVVDISEIEVGIVNYWGGTNEMFMEPTSIVVEGGMSLNNMNMICTLTKIRDDGFANFATSVFGKNMETFTPQNCNSNTLPSNLKLDLLPCMCARYLRFKFRKGIVTCAENSPLVPWLKKPKYLAINFISVMGYDVSALGNYCAYIIESQKETSLQVLVQFCSGDYRKTMQILASQEDILAKIKDSFEMLIALINIKERLIEPTLISISAINKIMGEWIIEKFLDPLRSKKQISLLTDLVLSSLEEVPSRLQKLKNFIFSELAKYKEIVDPSPDRINYLLNFIKAYNRCVRLGATMLKEPTILQQNTEELLIVLSILDKTTQPIIQKNLLKFLLLELYPPPQFQNQTVNPNAFFLKFLISEKMSTNKLILSSYFVSTDQQCARALLESGLLKKELCQGIKEDPVNGIPVASLLQFWLNCCAQPIIQEELARSRAAFQLYDSLKDTSEKPADPTVILKKLPEDVLMLAVELIKLLTSGKPELEKEMARCIMKDLELLTAKRDLDYVNKVLVPILRMEQTVPFCLMPYDSDSKRCLIVSRKNQSQVAQASHAALFVNTGLLNVKQKNSLLKSFKSQLALTSSFKKVAAAKWTRIFSETSIDQSKFAKFWESVQLQGPVFIIVSGTSNGKPCTFGAYTSVPLPPLPVPLEADFTVNVANAEDSFYLIYDENNCRHFKAAESDSFASFIVDSDLGGSVDFAGEFFRISFSYDLVMQFGDSSGVECIDEPEYKSPESNFTLSAIEVWSGKITKSIITSAEDIKKVPTEVGAKPVLAKHPWHNSLYSYNLFRAHQVYNVPVGVKASQLSLAILEHKSKMITRYNKKELADEVDIAGLYADLIEKCPMANGIIDVEYDIHEVIENDLHIKEKKEDQDSEMERIGYLPKMGVFERFEELGGVKELISVTLKSLKLWKNVDAANKWTLWLQEIESFSSIPLFFRLFIKNKKCKDLLFKILAGIPDQKPAPENKKQKDEETKKWEEEHLSAVRVSYQNLAEVFKISNDIKMREQAFDNGLIDRILERVGALTGEKGRKWEEKEEEVKAEKKEEKKKEVKNTSKGKRKGVGYSTNVGEVWKVQEYMESKKVKNEQIKIMIDILASFISATDWKPSKDLLALFAESPLMMLIENAFRSGSILEMCKESSIFFTYFDLIKAIAAQRKLVPLLTELDPHYKPTQSESICTLLKKLDSLSNIYLTCIKKEITEESKVTTNLATEINRVYGIVSKAVEQKGKA